MCRPISTLVVEEVVRPAAVKKLAILTGSAKVDNIM
jgi:hypothetical protein